MSKKLLTAVLRIILVVLIIFIAVSFGDDNVSELESFLDKNGLKFTVLENVKFCNSSEIPKVQKDELIDCMMNGLTVERVISSIENAIAKDDSSDWYITTVQISLKNIIYGDIEYKTFKVIEAVKYTNLSDEDVGPASQIEGLSVGMNKTH